LTLGEGAKLFNNAAT